jgi:hypothetical protein
MAMFAHLHTNKRKPVEDHLRYCKVTRAVGGQWAVWGNLEWTDTMSKEYAICPTQEAAEAARRLLSGEAARIGQ